MGFLPGQSGNPAGRPKGSVNRQLQMIRAAAELVLPMVLQKALAGDFESQKLILTLGMPKLKPVEVPLEFLLDDGETPSARAILQQVAAGELPVSSAQKIVHELMPAVAQEEKARALANKPHAPTGFQNAYLRSVLQQSG